MKRREGRPKRQSANGLATAGIMRCPDGAEWGPGATHGHTADRDEGLCGSVQRGSRGSRRTAVAAGRQRWPGVERERVGQAGAVGQEAIVTNALKTGRDGVLEEAMDGLPSR